MATPRIFLHRQLAPRVLPSACFAEEGRQLVDLHGALRALGITVAPDLRICSGAVHQAERGAIQDPAGSAIGGGPPARMFAGGASGAIYRSFPDLAPIPEIPPGASVFNASTGPGWRVLHTHSPMLEGSPEDPEARALVLSQLAQAYCGALLAFVDRAPILGEHGEVLDLVPLAASIFAGDFRDHAHVIRGHLDPGYTLAAILWAAQELCQAGHQPPALCLYYFEDPLVEVAESLLNP
ncbi:MAG: hypothetical protein KC431_14240 [Myxococcales bacterium]|nr:hypothetical protein [Myxococcales bacterium]